MNDYFLLRISLTDLEAANDKTEYRSLYSALKEEGFSESFFNKDDHEYVLPEGMYAMPKYFSLAEVRNKAEAALEVALSPFYESGWIKKYTLIVGGPSQILSRNLESIMSD